jgi:hypothetical protein
MDVTQNINFYSFSSHPHLIISINILTYQINVQQAGVPED